MRFRLVEAPAQQQDSEEQDKKSVKAEWPPSNKTLDSYDNLKSLEQQKSFLKERILPHPKFKAIFGVRPIILDSILKFGLDPRKNFFLNFVCKIKFAMPDAKTYKNKMKYVYDSFNNKKLDLNLPVLLNETLWTRSEADFRYTLNAFNMISQPKFIKAYLKDTDKTKQVNVSAFMDGNKVKSAKEIYDQIEEWAKGNEYSPEEIAKNKQALADEEEKNKGKSKDGSEVTINVNGSNSTQVEWSYEFFKEALEKVFANSSNFKTELSSKNDYLERAFATFKLTELAPQENENKVYKKAVSAIKDGDVAKFGDPHKIDEPIYLSVRDASNSIPGAYIFHKFVSLDDSSLNYYKQIANKNLGNLKRHLNKVNPDNDKDVNAHLQSIVDALGELSEIPQK